MTKRRNRFEQTHSLEERLIARAESLREQAAALAPGIEKKAILKLARQADAGESMSEWLRSSSSA
ncbi:hypothetical protein JQ616_24980 [Bradyrhizobium tropiciagri]|uniref:hypothetical protein n=1 Tax=Bradyrhizobium tropiciagri TaxID=312253 RepID=UPI001BAD7A5E|nr:hypothetical protein [Bradyrhizobium tropiciagri]MBR0898227.1 hypothetical protein [Bradyrhizobium tropiciagri]